MGKQRLLAAWSAADPQPFGRLTLDHGDNDPVRLFSYTIAVLQTLAESIGNRSASVPRERVIDDVNTGPSTSTGGCGDPILAASCLGGRPASAPRAPAQRCGFPDPAPDRCRPRYSTGPRRGGRCTPRTGAADTPGQRLQRVETAVLRLLATTSPSGPTRSPGPASSPWSTEPGRLDQRTAKVHPG